MMSDEAITSVRPGRHLDTAGQCGRQRFAAGVASQKRSQICLSRRFSGKLGVCMWLTIYTAESVRAPRASGCSGSQRERHEWFRQTSTVSLVQILALGSRMSVFLSGRFVDVGSIPEMAA